MTAQRAEYDGAASIGKFYDFSGWDSGLYYFKGDKGTYYRKDNKMVADRGYFTTKHAVAKVPDYRIEADTIEIYPGDHYTAYDVKLKVKNTTLISFPKYRASLKMTMRPARGRSFPARSMTAITDGDGIMGLNYL